MRKIELTPKPDELTEEVRAELTEEFRKYPDKAVWNKNYIKQALLNMTGYKCAYSEVLLQENSCYMEVEHFYPKSLYPEKVLEWGNLLPVCKVCNGKKGNIDPNKVPLINPLTEEPLQHLTFQNYLCKSLDAMGENSILYFDLNNLQFSRPRFTQIKRNETELSMLAEEVEEGLTDTAQKRFISRLKTVMQSGQESEPYSVCTSLAISSDRNYKEIRTFLMKKGLWDSKLQRLAAGLKHQL